MIIAFFFWIVISALLVAFVNALFQSTQDEIVEKEKIIILFIIIFSISVSAFIIFYIVNLFLAINRKEFGARMKLKITIFFIFIAILPIIPFIQIGTKFISSSMNLWFSKNFGFALDLSEEIIKTYYNEKRIYLSNFTDEINLHIKNNGLTYQKLIDTLPDLIEEKKINSLSIWDKNGQLLKQIGDEVFEVEIKKRSFSDKKIYLTKNEENIFNMETKKGLLYLVIPAKVFDVENNLLGFINFGIIIHPKFNKSITEIEDSLRNYNTANLYKDFFTRGFVSLFLIIIFPIILVILIISLFLSKDILDPIESLSKATKRVAEGDLNFQVGHSFNDEFMTLSQSFNRMINELDVSRTMLKQKEKIATWQDIAKQLAHEIKNPLTPIKLSVERLLKKYEDNSSNFPETIDKCSKTILKEVSNIDKLLNEFANFSEIIIFDKKPDEIL
nr:HAMP domain-containing protein [Spirochaetota bacterium]